MPISPPPPADFSRVARVYDRLASLVFGRAQRRAQLAALRAGLPLAGPTPQVLVLGGGPGWVLTELLNECPAARVLYLETSATMLAQARAQLARHAPEKQPQVEFRQGSERDLWPGEQFDAIVTFFVLDCFTLEEFPGALARLQAVRRPSAPWLVADFRPPRSWWQRGLLRAMYLFFRIAVSLRAQKLPPWPTALAEICEASVYQSDFYSGFIAAQVWR